MFREARASRRKGLTSVTDQRVPSETESIEFSCKVELKKTVWVCCWGRARMHWENVER